MKKTPCIKTRLGGYKVVRGWFFEARRWWIQRSGTGRRGEALAAQYLGRLGYQVLGRNVTTGVGEVDIIAEAPDGATVVLVEVKTRASAAAEADCDELRPESRVNHVKQRKLTALACVIAKMRGWSDRSVRFDVIGVELSPRRGATPCRSSVRRLSECCGFGPRVQPVIRHHMGAFEAQV